ncbi:MAG: hypothetical protein JKY01_08350 [Pseudomonadales bacterium]|nr:hypothetical protein [Pseudomonadales bacterium]
MGQSCYCGSGAEFETCCEPFIIGSEKPDTAERLMRSRYTAYALKNEDYLIETWHTTTRPLKKQVEDDKVKWHRLKVVKTVMGAAEDNTGEVLFEAIYKVNGKAHKHVERSLFEKEEGQWRYLDVKETLI